MFRTPRVRVSRIRRLTSGLAFGMAASLLLAPSVASAQTDYFNTDGGRPLRIQDATAVEWRAIELQFAPLKLERSRDGRWHPEVEPELALGILPRTVLSFGFPLVSADRPMPASSTADASRVNGLASMHVSVFHQLNMETRLPAFAVKADALLPVGPFAADNPYYTLTGIVTRTLSALGPVRVHGNVAYTMGDALQGDATSRTIVPPAPRWRAGVSMDRAFPLQSTLVAVEALAQRSLVDGDEVTWSTGAGVRHQFSPRIVMDFGVLRDLTGPDHAWSFTVGSAVALSLGRRLF
jgi:hypothetical protein